MPDLNTLPHDLPRPADDGACDHLPGMIMPSIAPPTTRGHAVDLASLPPGRTVIYCYPLTGRPGAALPDAERVKRFSEDAYALAFARIECHYFINRGFFSSDDQLIANAHRLSAIPGVIVHGRYDVVTPVKIAFDLARAWPEAELRMVPDSGHAMTESGIVHELVAATTRFAAVENKT